MPRVVNSQHLKQGSLKDLQGHKSRFSKALKMLKPVVKKTSLLFYTLINVGKHHQSKMMSYCHCQGLSRPCYQIQVLSRPWANRTKLQVDSRKSMPRTHPYINKSSQYSALLYNSIIHFKPGTVINIKNIQSAYKQSAEVLRL